MDMLLGVVLVVVGLFTLYQSGRFVSQYRQGKIAKGNVLIFGGMFFGFYMGGTLLFIGIQTLLSSI